MKNAFVTPLSIELHAFWFKYVKKSVHITQKQNRVLKVGKGSGGHQRLVLNTAKTFTFLRCDL